MTSITRLRIGTRLGIAFALLTLLLGTVVLVGLRAAASQAAATERLDQAAQRRRAALQLRYRSADLNVWQTAYAFDVVRGSRGAAEDTAAARHAFLASAAAFRKDLGVLRDRGLDAAQTAQIDAVEQRFVRFMQLDGQIIEHYRAGSAARIKIANELILVDEIELFRQISTGVDYVVTEVSQEAAASSSASRAAASSSRQLMLTCGGIAVAIAVVLALLVLRSVVRPLRPGMDRLDGMGAATDHPDRGRDAWGGPRRTRRPEA